MSSATLIMLERLIQRLNKITNSPLTTWKKVNDKMVANIGNFHLDAAYGGYKLVRMDNESGGIRSISNSGYTTKTKLYAEIHTLIDGIELITLG